MTGTATLTPRLKELNQALEQKTQNLAGMSADWKVEDNGGLVIAPEKYKAYMDEVAAAKQIGDLIEAEKSIAGFNQYLDAPAGSAPAGGAGKDAADTERARQSGEMARKSLADLFIGSEEYKQMKAQSYRYGGTLHLPGRDITSFEGFRVNRGQKDIYGMSAGTVDGIPGLGIAQQVDLVERQRRPGRIRDLYPSAQTEATVLFGVRETGWVNNAAVVSQRRAADETSAPTGGATDVFGKKPKSTITLETVVYNVARIAHLLDVHKDALDDEKRLRSILDADMIDGVKMVEDYELLYGAGGAERMTGLVNTPGIQFYNQSTNPSDKKSAAVRRSITRVMLAFYAATGVVMHPLDFEDVELEVDSTGAYTVAVSVAIGAEKRLWRLPIVETPAIDEGHFLVGAFGSGSKLYDREEVSVTVSTENRDNYERNVVTLRAEERCAFEVPRPESHCYGYFDV